MYRKRRPGPASRTARTWSHTALAWSPRPPPRAEQRRRLDPSRAPSGISIRSDSAARRNRSQSHRVTESQPHGLRGRGDEVRPPRVQGVSQREVAARCRRRGGEREGGVSRRRRRRLAAARRKLKAEAKKAKARLTRKPQRGRRHRSASPSAAQAGGRPGPGLAKKGGDPPLSPLAKAQPKERKKGGRGSRRSPQRRGSHGRSEGGLF